MLDLSHLARQGCFEALWSHFLNAAEHITVVPAASFPSPSTAAGAGCSSKQALQRSAIR
jgi:hypothetical protein